MANVTSGAAGPEVRATVREEQRQLTRRRLLDASIESFAAKGFAATTVEDIVAHAGVARGTFYLHFENKVEVVRAISDELAPSVGALYEHLDALLTTGSRDAVRDWMVRAINWFDTNRTMVLVWQEMEVTDPTLMVTRPYYIADQMTHYLAQWPQSARKAAQLRVVLLVHQLTRAFLLTHVRGYLDVDDDLLVDTLTDLWMNALQAPPPDPQ